MVPMNDQSRPHPFRQIIDRTKPHLPFRRWRFVANKYVAPLPGQHLEILGKYRIKMLDRNTASKRRDARF